MQEVLWLKCVKFISFSIMQEYIRTVWMLLECVYLEVKQGGYKTLEKKMGRKTFFWSVFGWVEREENKWWGPSVFSTDIPKGFLPKMEKKLKGENMAT